MLCKLIGEELKFKCLVKGSKRKEVAGFTGRIFTKQSNPTNGFLLSNGAPPAGLLCRVVGMFVERKRVSLLMSEL